MLVDSNILVYSLNPSSPKIKTAEKFLQDNKEGLVVSHQNILESIRVLTHKKFERRMTINQAMKAVTTIADSLTIIYPNSQTLFVALGLIQKFHLSGDQIFDAYLVGTMVSNGIKEIATDNEKDFSKFKIVNIYNPFSEN